jgi:hypothetical protein
MRKIGVILSGGNIDPEMLSSLLVSENDNHGR